MISNIRWHVNDGYVSGPRPQYSPVDPKEFQQCETDQEVRELLNRLVQADFEQRITFGIDNEDELVEAWRKSRPEPPRG
jgi:hypothetical protein